MLGDTLRQAREGKKLTLKDVESSTNIRIHYLEAIEKGDYSQIKGTVYLKGFIRTYAKFLGLDADMMLDKFYSEQNLTKEDPMSNVAPPPAQEALDQTQVFRPAPPQKPLPTKRPQESFKVESSTTPRRSNKKSASGVNLLFGSLIGIIILACIGYFVWPLFNSPEPKPAPVQQEVSSKQEEAPAPQIKGAHLTATFTKSCWVQVKADGKVIFSQTAKKGQSFTWNASKDIELRLGNAGAATISFNGQDLGTLGPDGSVISKTFTAQAPEDENALAADNQQQAEKAAPQREESRPAERTTQYRHTSDEQQQNSETPKSQPKAQPEPQAKAEPAPVKKAAAPAAPKTVPTPNSESTKKQ